MGRLIAQEQFELGSNLTFSPLIEPTAITSVIFVWTGADAVDGTFQLFVGNEDGTTSVESALTMNSASNSTDAKIYQINVLIEKLSCVYTANSNTEGTGYIKIYGAENGN